MSAVSFTPLANATFAGCCNYEFTLDNVNVAATAPEPASMLLLGTGLLGAGVRRRRQQRRG